MTTPHICFVIPPSPFLSDERVFMSLGVLKVASAIEATYPVDVLDLSGVANFEDVVTEYTLFKKTFYVGITVTTPQLPATVSIVKTIRQHLPTARIILGGPHITLVYAAYTREQAKGMNGRATTTFLELQELADVLVAGDGEKAILLALEPNPPKVINADDPDSGLFLRNEDLNEMPWAARHLIDVDSYHSSILTVKPILTLISRNTPTGINFTTTASLDVPKMD